MCSSPLGGQSAPPVRSSAFMGLAIMQCRVINKKSFSDFHSSDFDFIKAAVALLAI